MQKQKPTSLLILAGFFMAMGVFLAIYGISGSVPLVVNNDYVAMIHWFQAAPVLFLIMLAPHVGLMFAIISVIGLDVMDFKDLTIPVSFPVAMVIGSLGIACSIGLWQVKSWAKKISQALMASIFAACVIATLNWLIHPMEGTIFNAPATLVPLAILALILFYLRCNFQRMLKPEP